MADPAFSVPLLRDVDDFLSWAASQDGRFEFVDGRMRAMAPASPRHATLCARLHRRIGNALEDSPCETHDGSFGVRTNSARSYRSPDVTVACWAGSEHPRGEPIVVIEVLSPSTEREDYGAKRREYLALPSLRHYVVLAQDTPRAEMWTRTEHGWMFEEFAGEAATVPLGGVGVVLKLADLYADLPPEGETA